MAVVLALISALAYGTGDYCGGRATRARPLLAVSVLTLSSSTVLALLAVLADDVRFPEAETVGWSIGAGLMSLIGIFAFYEALARGAMTIVAPVTAVVSAIVPVVVGVASGERPSALAVIGVGIALVAVALVSGVGQRVERPTPSRIAVLALVAGVGFGLLFVFLDRTSDDSGFWPLGINQVTCMALILAIASIRRPQIVPVDRSGLIAIGAGVCNFVANVAYLLATREGLLSLVAVITSLYPGTTVLLATAIDGERMSRTQLFGVGLAVGAVALVGAGG